MKPITTKQVQFIKVLLQQRQLIDDSAGIAMQYSTNRTSHISELTVAEGIHLIKVLTAQNPTAKTPEETMRRKLISQAREMGWIVTVTNEQGKHIVKADMPRIQLWCTTYGYLHKDLNSYNLDELPKLLTQFGIVHKQFLQELK
jgi:hypothetical protein